MQKLGLHFRTACFHLCFMAAKCHLFDISTFCTFCTCSKFSMCPALQWGLAWLTINLQNKTLHTVALHCGRGALHCALWEGCTVLCSALGEGCCAQCTCTVGGEVRGCNAIYSLIRSGYKSSPIALVPRNKNCFQTISTRDDL